MRVRDVYFFPQLHMNTGVGGSLDTDKFSVVLLQYLNTPLRDVNKSPAQLATGRQLHDGVPAYRQYYKVDEHWKRTDFGKDTQLHPGTAGDTKNPPSVGVRHSGMGVKPGEQRLGQRHHGGASLLPPRHGESP